MLRSNAAISQLGLAVLVTRLFHLSAVSASLLVAVNVTAAYTIHQTVIVIKNDNHMIIQDLISFKFFINNC